LMSARCSKNIITCPRPPKNHSTRMAGS
jgi:hypothetical protein